MNKTAWMAIGGLITVAIIVFAASKSLMHRDEPQALQSDDQSDKVTRDTDIPAGVPSTGSVLDVARQRHIWDAEHVTFEIETYVGKPLMQALQQRNSEAVGHFFREEFVGSRIDSSSSESVEQYAARKRLWGRPLPDDTVDGKKFSDYLISRFEGFSDFHKLGMRVLAIETKDDESKNGRWKIRTLLTGLGETVDGEKIAFAQHGRAIVSFNSDEQIRQGSVISRWEVDDESLVISPVLMKEVTADYGLDKLPLHDNWKFPGTIARQYTHHVAVADYDLDGQPDIAVSSKTGDLRLLRTLPGGGTKDVTLEVTLPENMIPNANWRTAVTWIDIDNDAYPDLLVGQDLFRNEQGKKFILMRDTGLKLGYNPMGTAVADFDCDGLLDLYVLYQGRDIDTGQSKPGWINDDQSGAENQLWKNMGDGTFSDVTEASQSGGGRRRSFAAIWFHANEDRFPDLYVANDFGTNSLLINTGKGTFTDQSADSQTADFATSMGVAAGDLNGDGRSDIYVANMYSKMGRRIVSQVNAADYAPGIYEHLQGACSGNRLYLNPGGDEPYREVSESLGINQVGWAYSPAIADFDRDGFLDIYATAGFVSYHRHKPDG